MRPLFDIAVFRALGKAVFLRFGLGVFVVVRLAVEELPLAARS